MAGIRNCYIGAFGYLCRMCLQVYLVLQLEVIMKVVEYFLNVITYVFGVAISVKDSLRNRSNPTIPFCLPIKFLNDIFKRLLVKVNVCVNIQLKSFARRLYGEREIEDRILTFFKPDVAEI